MRRADRARDEVARLEGARRVLDDLVAASRTAAAGCSRSGVAPYFSHRSKYAVPPFSKSSSALLPPLSASSTMLLRAEALDVALHLREDACTVSSFFCILSPVQNMSMNFGTSVIMSSMHELRFGCPWNVRTLMLSR